MDLNQQFDKKWAVKHRYGHNSIFQKMDLLLRLSYFDATIYKQFNIILKQTYVHFPMKFIEKRPYVHFLLTKRAIMAHTH